MTARPGDRKDRTAEVVRILPGCPTTTHGGSSDGVPAVDEEVRALDHLRCTGAEELDGGSDLLR